MDRAADPLCGVVERLAEQLSLQPIEGVDPRDYYKLADHVKGAR